MSKNAKERVPIILLHGAWHGAWAFVFLAKYLFELLGYKCHTLSFSGHEEGKSKKKRIWHSLGRYVNDVERLVGEISSDIPPILIGHSMGGLVAQIYAQKHPVSAMVLLASVPSSGALGVLLRFARKHPWLTTKFFLTISLYPAVENFRVIRELFFSEIIGEREAREWQEGLVTESFIAFLWALWPRAFSRDKMYSQDAPVLVLHATNDALVTREQSVATARAYGESTLALDKTAHCDMLADENKAERVAYIIYNWLQSQVFKKISS